MRCQNCNIKSNTNSRRYLIVKPTLYIVLASFAVDIQTVLRGIDFESMDSAEMISDIKKFMFL